MDSSTVDGYRDGDIIWVDPEQPIAHGVDVVVSLHAGALVLRRLQRTPEGDFLQALNRGHPDSTARLSAGDRIIGVVIFSGRARG